jgi:hypothetical protein
LNSSGTVKRLKLSTSAAHKFITRERSQWVYNIHLCKAVWVPRPLRKEISPKKIQLLVGWKEERDGYVGTGYWFLEC